MSLELSTQHDQISILDYVRTGYLAPYLSSKLKYKINYMKCVQESNTRPDIQLDLGRSVNGLKVLASASKVLTVLVSYK